MKKVPRFFQLDLTEGKLKIKIPNLQGRKYVQRAGRQKGAGVEQEKFLT